MQAHQPPPGLDDIADRIAADACSTVTAADRHRGDRHGDGLDAAAVLLAAVDRIIAAVIMVLQTTDHRAVIADHGLTRDTWLRAVAGRTGADAGMLLAAADRLADMPAVTAWFHQGSLSWGAVRQIIAATRNLTAAQRGWVDQTLADGEVVRLDQDQIAAAVDGLAHRARPDLHRDRDTNALARRWLTLQPRLDGTADIAGTLDPETAAAALAAFATTTPATDHDPDTHDGDTHDGDTHDSDDGDGGLSDGDRVRVSRRRANVDIFGDLCRLRLTRHQHTTAAEADATDGTDGTVEVDAAAAAAGDARDGAATGSDHAAATGDADTAVAGDAIGATGARRHGHTTAAGGSCPQCGWAPPTARPAFLVVADLAALDPDAPGGSGTARLHWATNRAPVELTPAAAQRLACDATLRVVVADGTDVLGVTAAHPKVSATLRAALIVRDGGCRFPGCTQPAERCDTHHIIPVAHNGPTCLANLALICRDHHHAIHDGGWQATLHADAAMTFTRRGVTLASQPRARQHPTPTQPPPTGRPQRHRTGRPPGHEPAPATEPPPADAAAADPTPELLPF